MAQIKDKLWNVMRNKSTSELHDTLGNFEQELETAKISPTFELSQKYGGVLSDGELNMMRRYQAITFEQDFPVIPYYFNIWRDKMAALYELRDRREYAQKQEALANSTL